MMGHGFIAWNELAVSVIEFADLDLDEPTGVLN